MQILGPYSSEVVDTCSWGARDTVVTDTMTLPDGILKIHLRYVAVTTLVVLVAILAKARRDELVHGRDIRQAAASLIAKHHANT